MNYIANTSINDGKQVTEPGEPIDLSEEAAAPLLAIGAIAEVGPAIEGAGTDGAGTEGPETDGPNPKEATAKKAANRK